jgi:DNA-binding transcriptional MerR regulator
MSSREPEHLSIGEVLAELSDEFPDITISKIRFLESQGLVNPERTPSGYRKFYAHDLARLRWILYQQKEHFLPLKVIKERLDELPPGEEARLLDPTPAIAAAADEAEPAPVAVTDSTSSPKVAAPAPPPRRRPQAFAPTLPADEGAPDDDLLGAPGADAQYSRAELVAAAGLVDAQLSELESYGLVAPSREVDGVAQYDDDALEVARIAAGFFRRGIEARHLRMYRTSAEREAVLFGQVLMPYVRQRNPEARGRLQDELIELSTLGRRLRAALLRDAVRETLAE